MSRCRRPFSRLSFGFLLFQWCGVWAQTSGTPHHPTTPLVRFGGVWWWAKSLDYKRKMALSPDQIRTFWSISRGPSSLFGPFRGVHPHFLVHFPDDHDHVWRAKRPADALDKCPRRRGARQMSEAKTTADKCPRRKPRRTNVRTRNHGGQMSEAKTTTDKCPRRKPRRTNVRTETLAGHLSSDPDRCPDAKPRRTNVHTGCLAGHLSSDPDRCPDAKPRRTNVHTGCLAGHLSSDTKQPARPHAVEPPGPVRLITFIRLKLRLHFSATRYPALTIAVQPRASLRRASQVTCDRPTDRQLSFTIQHDRPPRSANPKADSPSPTKPWAA